MGSEQKDPGKEAAKIQREQLSRLDAIDLPELRELIMQDPELVGLLDAEQLGDSAMEDIRIDPRLQEAQRAALADLEEAGRTGLTAEDRAQMGELTRQTDAAEQARQKGILQNMAERGSLDSGSQLIAQLQSNAASSTDARRQAEQLAAQAAASRRQALQQAGGMAGQMAGQEFQQGATKASARDQINQFNAQQRMGVQQQNLAARQAMANQATQNRNQETMYNLQRDQQQFQNELAKAGAQGGVTNNLSQIAGSQPQGPSGMQQLMTVGGGIVGGIYGGPAGASAGASAGSAVGGMFEDGGIAGEEYNNGGIPGMFDFQNTNVKKGIEQGGGAIIGQGNDAISAEVQTEADAQEVMPKEEGSGMEADDVAALAGIAKLLGNNQKKASAPKYKFQNNVDASAAKNIMNVPQQQTIANPFRAADGGISYESEGKGDIVDVPNMDNYAGDRVDAKINEGEMILNVPQQQRLMDMIRGEISPQELGDGDIVEGVPVDYRDRLHAEKSPKKSARDEKIEGLEKLLQALGRNK